MSHIEDIYCRLLGLLESGVGTHDQCLTTKLLKQDYRFYIKVNELYILHFEIYFPRFIPDAIYCLLLQ